MAGGLWLDGDLGSVCDSRQIISRDSSLASAVLTALGMDEDILCTRAVSTALARLESSEII